jgi:hypothetical protein
VKIVKWDVVHILIATIYVQKWYSFAQKIVEFRVYYGVLILGLVVNSEFDNLLCKRIPLL